MARANEIHCISPELFVWQAYEPAVKCDLTSTAVRVGARLVLIDPIALAPAASEELLGYGNPELVVCTSANHGRAAVHYRDRFGLGIAAHPDARDELGFEVDMTVEDGSRIEKALEIKSLPGAATGEIALIMPGKLLCVGDALIHLPQTGFSLLPDKYCTDTKLLRQSLRNLLRYDFSTLTFAHGLPLVTQARSRLEALLA